MTALRNRVVASSAYGATNTTFAIAPDRIALATGDSASIGRSAPMRRIIRCAMNVVFLEPSFPANQKQFVRGLHEVGATVIGIGERPKDWLDGDVAGWLAHYEQVDVGGRRGPAARGRPRAAAARRDRPPRGGRSRPT